MYNFIYRFKLYFPVTGYAKDKFKNLHYRVKVKYFITQELLLCNISMSERR